MERRRRNPDNLHELVIEFNWKLDHGEPVGFGDLFETDGAFVTAQATLRGGAALDEFAAKRTAMARTSRSVLSNHRLVRISDDVIEGAVLVTLYMHDSVDGGPPDAHGRGVPRRLRPRPRRPLAVPGTAFHPGLLEDRMNPPTNTTDVITQDLGHLQYAIDLARQARADGNRPFGAVLVGPDGIIAAATNTAVTGNDPTGHAETNLVRSTGALRLPHGLADTTMYASTEPS